jgi:hypothetical protein
MVIEKGREHRRGLFLCLWAVQQTLSLKKMPQFLFFRPKILSGTLS